MLAQVFSKPIVIQYGGSNTIELFRFFYGLENDFYVDLGAYDAISRSNTLDLYVAGWDGINIDASPSRLSYLLKMRKDNINLGMAVGLSLYAKDIFSPPAHYSSCSNSFKS